jgi:dienelactone hydrolase
VVRRRLLLVLTLVSASCSPIDVRPAASSGALGAAVASDASLFAYDASAPLELVERSSAADGSLMVRDVDFASPKGGRARAYVITPQATGRVPAMVFIAGSNQRREDIRAEAIGVARRGVVTLILEQSQVAAARPPIWTFTAQDRAEAIQTVIDARRAIDLLAARADVDPTRIGYYGFSYGAWLGAITSVVDKRVGLLVLRSGGPQILADIARASSRNTTAEYEMLMTAVDQMAYAANITTPVLVQNGSRDTTYTTEQMRAWQERVGGTKTVKTYDAGHTLDARSLADALSWIAERWRLP